MLNYLHGGNLIRPDLNIKLNGEFHLFDQKEYFSFPPSLSSMDTQGYFYMPEACKNGGSCALHIAFHGCKQYR